MASAPVYGCVLEGGRERADVARTELFAWLGKLTIRPRRDLGKLEHAFGARLRIAYESAQLWQLRTDQHDGQLALGAPVLRGDQRRERRCLMKLAIVAKLSNIAQTCPDPSLARRGDRLAGMERRATDPVVSQFITTSEVLPSDA